MAVISRMATRTAGVWVLIASAAFSMGQAAEPDGLAGTYGKLLQGNDVEGVLQQLLKAVPGPDARAHIVAAAQAAASLNDSRQKARLPERGKTMPPVLDRVFDGLVAKGTPTAVTIAAELLLEYRIDYLRDAQLEKLARLLDHDDPFVRGIAEYAIQLYVQEANHNNKPVPTYASDTQGSSWFEAWQAKHDAGHFAEWSAVQHAFENEVHRTPADLSRDAEAKIGQLEGLLAHARANRLGGVAAAQAALEEARRARAAIDGQARIEELTAVRKAWMETRLAARRGVLAVAEAWAPRVAYVKRRSFQGQHNISGESQHQVKVPPPSDILIQAGLDCPAPDSVLKGQLPRGSIRGIDLFYDADRFVFSYSIQTPEFWDPGVGNYEWPQGGGKPQKLYEISVNGNGLRRISPDDKYVDMEPTYLPDGTVVCMSDRGHGASECGGWEQNACNGNLYRFYPASNGEGTAIRRLSWNKDYDRYPHTLNDGRIGYTRWMYQEQGIFQPHTLWSVRPDGTQNDALYKTHIDPPHSLRDAMPVPDSTKLVAIATGHHHLPEGWLLLIDLAQGINESAAMRALALGSSPVQGGMPRGLQPVPEGGVRDSSGNRGGWYQTPWGLSEKSFLVSHCSGRWVSPNAPSFGHALYYVDVWGNKELIARDPYQELAYPMVVRPRRKPPLLPDTTDPGKNYALAYVHNVYNDLPGVQQGEARFIRISHRVDWVNFKDNHGTFRWYPHYAAFSTPTFGYFEWSGTRVIGTVPVHEDGSAYFKVPPYTPLYFQLLDKDFVEIRRERSHVEFQPGETRGCIGCHEMRAELPVMTGGLRAAQRQAPDTPRPLKLAGPKRMLDFETMIQPLFDARCQQCHGERNPARSVELTRRKDGFGYMQSYRSLFGVKWGEPTPQPEPTARWFAAKWPEYDASAAKILDEQASQAWWKNVYRRPGNRGQLLAVENHRAARIAVSNVREFGSNHSRLIQFLLNDEKHRQRLDRDEWELLVTWVDALAPYSGRLLMKYDADRRELPRVVPVDVIYPDPWTEMDPFSACGQVVVPQDYRTTESGRSP